MCLRHTFWIGRASHCPVSLGTDFQILSLHQGVLLELVQVVVQVVVYVEDVQVECAAKFAAVELSGFKSLHFSFSHLYNFTFC